MEVREKYGNEYAALTPAEKEELVVEFESKRVNPPTLPRVTTQSRVQDFAQTYTQISDLVRSNALARLVADGQVSFRCRT